MMREAFLSPDAVQREAVRRRTGIQSFTSAIQCL